RDGLIRVRNIRALNGRFNTSITHAYSIVIGSKHITLNATGGGFLTASKQFRHGATSKSRSNTASNSTKHKSPHLRSEERFSRNAETDLVCRLLLEKKKNAKNDILNYKKRRETIKALPRETGADTLKPDPHTTT